MSHSDTISSEETPRVWSKRKAVLEALKYSDVDVRTLSMSSRGNLPRFLSSNVRCNVSEVSLFLVL